MKYPETLPPDEIRFSIDRLKEYCSNNSWGVVYTNKNLDECRSKVIYLYKNHSPETEYYSLLHEMGHLYMLHNDYTYSSRYPESSKRVPAYNTSSYRIERVKEEIEAWDVGENLARSLGLRINKLNYKKIKSENLVQYMMWASLPTINRRKRKTEKIIKELENKKPAKKSNRKSKK